MKNKYIVVIRDNKGNFKNQYAYKTYNQAIGAKKRFQKIDFFLKVKNQYTIYKAK